MKPPHPFAALLIILVACSVLAVQAVAQAPAVPSNVNVQAMGPRKMQITWTDNALDETGYVVERATSPGASTWLASNILAVDAATYEDTQSLQGNMTYYYRIKVVNGTGESYSSMVSGATPDYPAANQSPDGIGLFTFNIGLNFSDAVHESVTDFEGADVDAAKDGDLVASSAGQYWLRRHTPATPSGASALDEVDVYLKSGSSWTYQSTLEPPVSAGSTSGFGTAVVASGSRIFVGAPGATNSLGVASGVVYVYELSGSTLSLVQTLEPPSGAAGDEFGFAIAVDGARLIIGAPGRESPDSTPVVDAGAVYLYERETAWSLLRTERGQTSEAGVRFGFSVAVKNRILAIGAPYEDVTFNVSSGTHFVPDAGSAYLGLWNRPNEWAHYTNMYFFFPEVVAKIEGLEGSHFGWSVAISDMMRVAIGMPDSSWVPADNMTGWDAGLVMVFHWHGVIDTGKQFVVDVFSHEDMVAGNRFGEYIEAGGGGMDFGTQTALRVDNAPVHYYSAEAVLLQPGALVGGVEQPWTVGEFFGVDPDDDPITFEAPFIADAPGDHFQMVGPVSFGTLSTLAQVVDGLHPAWFTVNDDRGGTYSVKSSVEISGGAADTDGDGLPDWWEMQQFGSLDQAGAGDLDGDGFTNFAEYANGSDPNVWTGEDGDGDGVPDTLEIAVGTNPAWKDNPAVQLIAKAISFP